MAQYGKVDRVAVAVSLLQLHAHDETLEPVLDAIGHAIAAAWSRLDRAQASNDPDYLSVVEDAESAIVEALLGTAFIACQTRVTAITAGAHLVRSTLDAQRAAKLPFDGSKASVHKLGGPIAGSSYTDVALINAVANYFKHNDEWDHPADWSKLTGQSKGTAGAIASIGLKAGSTGNLRQAAVAFGWDASKPESIHEIAAPIAKWAEKVIGLVRSM